jgi:hypothetical protein
MGWKSSHDSDWISSDTEGLTFFLLAEILYIYLIINKQTLKDMVQEIIQDMTRIWSQLEGVQQAAFSFWLIVVAGFYGTLCYISYLGLAHILQKIWPKKTQGLNPKNRF